MRHVVEGRIYRVVISVIECRRLSAAFRDQELVLKCACSGLFTLKKEMRRDGRGWMGSNDMRLHGVLIVLVISREEIYMELCGLSFIVYGMPGVQLRYKICPPLSHA